MVADQSDPTAADRGDAVRITGGQFLAQTGTLVRRNGSSALVALHPRGMVTVRTFDGRLWAVAPSAMLELTPVHPASEYVERL